VVWHLAGLAMIFNVWLFLFNPRGTDAGPAVPHASLDEIDKPRSLSAARKKASNLAPQISAPRFSFWR
jgi:hypothetical protein